MRKFTLDYFTRKSHRYLGLILGIQFLMWTLGGLYFSWNDIDDVHGDHLLKERTYLPGKMKLISPEIILEAIKNKQSVDSIINIQLIEIHEKPVYQIRYFTSNLANQSSGNSISKIQLADAETGILISPLSESDAIKIAKRKVKDIGEIEKVEYLTSIANHHEYRGKPLPAWAVTFKSPSNITAYIAAEMGTFQSVRHDQWRAFDFLWMLHTMDYQGRDNFGNILLKAFSIFGSITIISGFVLFFISSPTLRKFYKRNN